MARSFNGSSDNYSVSADIIGSFPFTVVADVRQPSSASSKFFSVGDPSSNTQHISVGMASNFRPHINSEVGGSSDSVVLTPPGSANTWYRLVFILNATNSIIYRDNTGDTTSASTTVSFPTATTTYIGRRARSSFPDWWNGEIHNLGIIKVNPSADQINALLKGGDFRTIFNAGEIVDGLPLTRDIYSYKGRTWSTTGTTVVSNRGDGVWGSPRHPKLIVIPAAGNSVTMPNGTVTTTGNAPQATTTENKFSQAPNGTVTTTGNAPQVTATDKQDVTMPSGTVTSTGNAPSVTATENKFSQAPNGTVVTTGNAPQATTTEHRWSQLGNGTVVTTGNAPLVDDGAVSGEQVSLPNGTVTTTGNAPQATTTENRFSQAPNGTVVTTGNAPQVTATENRQSQLPQGLVVSTGNAPQVTATENKFSQAPNGAVTTTGNAPQATATENKFVSVPQGLVVSTGNAPTVNDGGAPAEQVNLPNATIQTVGNTITVTRTEFPDSRRVYLRLLGGEDT